MEKTTCRICFDDDVVENMICPCKCKGSIKYVHRECLNKWRSISTVAENFKRCNQCKFEYVIEVGVNPSEETRSSKYKKAMIKEVLYFLLYVVVSIIILTILIKTADIKSYISKRLGPSGYIVCAVIAFLTLTIILKHDNINFSVPIIFLAYTLSLKITIMSFLVYNFMIETLRYMRKVSYKIKSTVLAKNIDVTSKVKDFKGRESEII
jgi:hypothetical protein